MIKRKESILLYEQPVFSIIDIETPSSENLALPSDACVAYILNGNDQLLSNTANITAQKEHAIVSLCGLTLGNMLANQPPANINSIVVHLNRELLTKVFEGEKPTLWEELNKPVTQYVVQIAASEMVKLYFSSVLQFFDNKAALTETILQLKLKEIILLLLQTDNAYYVRQIIMSLFSERKFDFKELVEAHIEHTNDIQNLAMATNCSVSTFKRKFKAVFQTTPAKYRLTLKLNKVAQLIKTTDSAISSIGYECGFESPEHLSRVFKKQFKLSPSQYRLNFTVK